MGTTPLTRAVGLVKLGVGVAVVAVLVASGVDGQVIPGAAPGPGSAVRAAGDAGSVPRCDATPSPQARESGADHTMAVVRTPAGQTRVVSFERGWAVYNGRAPGTFVRVCRV